MSKPQSRPGEPRLFDRLHDAIRLRHFSPRTEKTYRSWIKQFIVHHGLRHPRDLGPPEIEAFLSFLATDKQVSASAQNQALAALLFLYVHVLGAEPMRLAGLVRAKRAQRVPTVLTRQEVAALLQEMNGPTAVTVHRPDYLMRCA